MNQPSVFEFTDFREFLRQLFEFKKATVPTFSHRNFARMAGFASPNFLKLVIDGQRNLTNASIAKVARGFKLKKAERDYFENLVYMNQAPDHLEKNHYYQKLIAMKTPKSMKLLENAQYDYFSKWYLPVLRELVMFDGQTATARDLAERLSPKVGEKEVQAALDQLEHLGFIFKDENGRWQQSEQILATAPEVKSLLIANFHHEMINMADAAIDRYPADKRDISAITLSISQTDIPEIKNRIREFRKAMLKEFICDSNPDQVIQVNIQMFPLTNPHKKENNK